MEITGRVFRLTNSISNYKRMVDQIGSEKDTEDFRRSLAHQGEAIAEDARGINTALKALTAPPANAHQPHTLPPTVDKLLSDFKLVLSDFQRAQRLCADREGGSFPRRAQGGGPSSGQVTGAGGATAGPNGRVKQSRARGAAALSSDPSPPAPAPAPPLQSQAASLQQEVAFNEALIEERDRGIQEIQQSIVEVNEIFRDLAVIVREQGEQVQDLEANLIKTDDRVRQAGEQLARASRVQRATRGQMWCILIAVVVLIVVLLTLLT